MKGLDYVRTARAKGLSERRVLTRHTLRNCLIPVVTLFGLDLGAAVGGTVILIEPIFGLEGVGQYAQESVSHLDLPPMMALTLYGAFFVVIMNAVVDVAYAWLDPRTREAQERNVHVHADIATIAVAGLVAGCGSSGSSSSSGGGGGAGHNGGTLEGGIPDNPDHLDTGISYAVEGWQILEATNNGLVTFKKAAGPAGSDVVPDIATAMPQVTDGGRTYSFQLHTGVMFGPPVNRAVKPSTSSTRSSGLLPRRITQASGSYTSIVGADAYAAGKAQAHLGHRGPTTPR